MSSVAEGDCQASTPDKPKLPSEVWVLVTANAVIALGYGVVAPVLPQYARNFGVSIAAATFVITAFALMRLCAAPVSGILVQKLGERRIYLTGLVIVARVDGCVRVRADLLAAAGVPVARRVRVGDVHGVVAGSDDPDLAVGRAGARRRAVLECLPGRLGGWAGARQPHGRDWASSAPFVIYGVALLIAAAVVFFRLRHSSLAAADVQTEPAITVRVALRNSRLPGGAVLELRHRLVGVRPAHRAGAAVRGGGAGSRRRAWPAWRWRRSRSATSPR